MTKSELDAILKGITQPLLAHIRSEIASAIVPLQQRLQIVEERKALAYIGVFQRAVGAQAGQCCTHGGALWYCTMTTTDTPGSSQAWQLMGKTHA